MILNNWSFLFNSGAETSSVFSTSSAQENNSYKKNLNGLHSHIDLTKSLSLLGCSYLLHNHGSNIIYLVKIEICSTGGWITKNLKQTSKFR